MPQYISRNASEAREFRDGEVALVDVLEDAPLEATPPGVLSQQPVGVHLAARPRERHASPFLVTG